MVINKIEKTDSGEWKCIAESIGRSVSYQKDIQVQTVPEILGNENAGPIHRDISEFETLNLECNIGATTGPMPKITWLKDGQLVEDVVEPERLWFSNNRTSLHVYRLEVIESGQYTCKVENRAGASQLQIDVNVQRPPVIDGPSDVNVEITASHQLELNCPVKGIPMPDVEWYRHGRRVAYANNMSIKGFIIIIFIIIIN